MKTPDEIKKGLECCKLHYDDMYTDCSHCPYYLTSAQCDLDMHADALDIIQQLEAANAEVLNLCKQLEAKCHQLESDKKRLMENAEILSAAVDRLERERDAAVEDMATVIYNGAEIVCQFCKHKDEHKCAQICGFAFKGFEWRGVKEE